MSLHDCEECWEITCVCGHQYRNWSIKDLEKQIAMLQAVLAKKKTGGVVG